VLRSLVGRQTGVRFTPILTFVADAVPDHARAIDELLVRAKEADNEVHRKAAGASYAGDPDPYRADDEPEDEPADGTDA
jgi:ribosome-binding factor A